MVSIDDQAFDRSQNTYSSILGSFRAAALQCDSVALVLEALRSNQTLNLGGLCVGFGALLLGLNLTANDEFPDLSSVTVSSESTHGKL